MPRRTLELQVSFARNAKSLGAGFRRYNNTYEIGH